MKDIKEALEIGLDCARDFANHVHDAYSGYMPEYHKQAADNVQKIKSALIGFDSLISPPAIGAMWQEQGGIYAGIVGGINGKPDYHLIHSASGHEIFDVEWYDAINAAKDKINGFTDWYLPDCRESRLLAINSPDSFDWDVWYWTSMQDSEHPEHALVQHFGEGSPYAAHKSFKYRARAVRRLPINT